MVVGSDGSYAIYSTVICIYLVYFSVIVIVLILDDLRRLKSSIHNEMLSQELSEMFNGAHILIEEVDGVKTVKYVNEHFLSTFEEHIPINFEDKIEDTYKVSNICQYLAAIFGYTYDQDDTDERARKLN